jgi:hypothetical protein
MIRKITFGLTVLLSGMTASALASDRSPCNVTVPCYNGGVTFGVSGLYLRPTSGGNAYAFVSEVTPGGIFKNHLKSVKPDYDWGYSVSLGYIFQGTANDVNLTYTNFNHHTKDSVADTGPFFIAATTPFIFPGDVILDKSLASASYNYQTLDVDFGQHFNIGCNTHVKLIGGVRLADLESSFKTRYDGVMVDPGLLLGDAFVGNTERKSKFEGAGPRVGTAVEYSLGNGFGVVGQATTSLLVGNVRSNHLQHEVVLDGDDVNVFEVTTSEHRGKHPHVVPNLNAKLGVNYNYQFCNPTRTKLTLEAGYQVDHYFNVEDRINGFDAFATGNLQAINTSFNGPYVGLQIKA